MRRDLLRGPAAVVADTVAEAAQLRRIRAQRDRLDSLEVAVRENVLLEAGLEIVVNRLEQSLVPLLDAREQR